MYILQRASKNYGRVLSAKAQESALESKESPVNICSVLSMRQKYLEKSQKCLL